MLTPWHLVTVSFQSPVTKHTHCCVCWQHKLPSPFLATSEGSKDAGAEAELQSADGELWPHGHRLCSNHWTIFTSNSQCNMSGGGRRRHVIVWFSARFVSGHSQQAAISQKFVYKNNANRTVCRSSIECTVALELLSYCTNSEHIQLISDVTSQLLTCTELCGHWALAFVCFSFFILSCFWLRVHGVLD